MSGSVVFGWSPAAGARLEAAVDHTGRQFEDDGNTRRLEPATVLDLSARVPLTGWLSGWARLENVAGERVEAAVDDDGVVERARPRALMVGVVIRAP